MTMVSELMSQMDGMPVVGLVGSIKRAFDPRTGIAKNGNEWTNMGLIIADDNGDEINVTWWDPTTTDWRKLIDRKVEVSSRGGKGGLKGAMLSEYTAKTGEVRKSISCRTDCLLFIDGDPPPSSGPTASPSFTPSPASPSPVSSGGSSYSSSSLKEEDLLKAIGRYADFLADETNIPIESHAQIINTLLIAVTNGKAKLAEDAPPAKPEPGTYRENVATKEDDESDIPF